MKLFIVGGLSEGQEAKRPLLQSSMRALGAELGRLGHDIVLCSPFEGSADREVLYGLSNAASAPRIEMHYPSTAETRDAVRDLICQLGLSIQEFPHAADASADPNIKRYGWLLAQLSALDSAHAVIAAGGNPTGSANMLLHLAEARRTPILPLANLGGAAATSLERQRYSLEDRIGAELVGWLHSAVPAGQIEPALARLSASATAGDPAVGEASRFFISYARPREADADLVETMLRRRGYNVFRDDQSFDPSMELTSEIEQAIVKSNVFIALWSAEYACSPWCYDEVMLALARLKDRQMAVWLLQLDDTRVVPPGARGLTGQPCQNREQLQTTMLKLLDAHEGRPA
jgi:hypothetical protein